MPIEVQGPDHFLEELRLFLADQFSIRGFKEGPKVGSMDSGITINYIRDQLIVAVHIKEGAERDNSFMYVESEQEIPELAEIWDDAIINYGKELLKRLGKYSFNKDKVNQALKN